MWSPLSALGLVDGGTDTETNNSANALQNAQREAIAYRLRIKELNVQIKEERQKATEKIRSLEVKCSTDGGTSTEKRKSSDSTVSEGSHEVIALRKRADQLMLIKAASEFRILELEGKAKKYKARLTQVMRERNDLNRNDNMSVLGSVASHASTNQGSMQRDNSANGYGIMNTHHTDRSPKKDKEEDRDDELASKIGAAGFGSEEEMATLVLARIRELDEELEEVKQELVQATSERDQLQMIKANLEATNIQNETKVPALEEEVAMFQMLLEKERTIINGLHEALDAEKNEILAIEEKKIEMEKMMAANVAMLEVFQKERADFEAQRNEMEKSLNKVRSQTTFLSAERNVEENKLKKQLERAMEERDKLSTERSLLATDLKSSKEEVKKVHTTKTSIEKDLADKTVEIMMLKENKTRLTSDRDTAQTLLASLQQETQVLQAKLIQLEQEMQQQQRNDSSSSSSSGNAPSAFSPLTDLVTKDNQEVESMRSKNQTLQLQVTDLTRDKKAKEIQLEILLKKTQQLEEEQEQLRNAVIIPPAAVESWSDNGSKSSSSGGNDSNSRVLGAPPSVLPPAAPPLVVSVTPPPIPYTQPQPAPPAVIVTIPALPSQSVPPSSSIPQPRIAQPTVAQPQVMPPSIPQTYSIPPSQLQKEVPITPPIPSIPVSTPPPIPIPIAIPVPVATPIPTATPLPSHMPSATVPVAVVHSAPPPPPLSEIDAQRLSAIQEVNRILRGFTIDAQTKDVMNKETVQLALALWAGKNPIISEAQTSMIQACPGVVAVYPKVKELEEICARGKLKLPLDLVAEGKDRLDNTTLITTFGPEFCVNHGLLS